MKILLTLLVGISLCFAGTEALAKNKKGLVSQMSGQGYGSAGCGLGSVLFGQEKGMIQVLASWLNWTVFINQTFGITFGTSNCEKEGALFTEAYIHANRASLETDASRGTGETLERLSALIGCKDASLFGSKMQENFEGIFVQNDDAKEVEHAILRTIEADSELAQSCTTSS